jgi:phage shock protein E
MQQLKDMIRDKKAFFVDVRSPQEFNEDHIANALNIPLDQIMGRMDELEGIEGPIILYCRSGNRSGMALHILQSEGFKNLYNGGGIDDVRYLLN